MGNYLKERRSNYDKYPFVEINNPGNKCWDDWDAICSEVKSRIRQTPTERIVIILDAYQGADLPSMVTELSSRISLDEIFDMEEAMKSESEIFGMVHPDVTDDRVFGYMTRLHLTDFFDEVKLDRLKQKIAKSGGTVLVHGIGAALVCKKSDILLYADMARWEIQKRQRKNLISNLGTNNKAESASLKYKRSYFVDWRVCDRHKKELFEKWDYVIDANLTNKPKMLTGGAYLNALKQVSSRPFRLVPFFDPGPWGGEWMREVCDLDKEAVNYAWCFDCVPEENSLLLKIGDVHFETPSINLVFQRPMELLGKAVYGRFGDEFPIRFDFLDTMEGGNLSLQVHPLTQYIQEHFGMNYTQDESYYLLDAIQGDASVYLGVKNGVNREAMVEDLNQAQEGKKAFDAEKYVNKWPAKKHDHFLIPAGTIHCSGSESMVLEISATPYIFTFKLWDWGRVGLDGKPRPINIKHGKKNIQWQRDASWTKKNLINKVEQIAEGKGWIEERTGLHEAEFIETRRHWFTDIVYHNTGGSVNVLNLVEGDEVVVESPSGGFDPFVVHYAETFVVPEAVKHYTIRPYGRSEGKKCATIKAFVRH